jgi:hypothetical protein
MPAAWCQLQLQQQGLAQVPTGCCLVCALLMQLLLAPAGQPGMLLPVLCCCAAALGACQLLCLLVQIRLLLSTWAGQQFLQPPVGTQSCAHYAVVGLQQLVGLCGLHWRQQRLHWQLLQQQNHH